MKEFWIGYWFKPWYLLYKIGYAIVITGIRSYFKNHQYDGKKSIPANTESYMLSIIKTPS